jgi:hypothetical protein
MSIFVSYVALLSHSSFMRLLFFLGILIGPSALLIVSFLQALVDNIYPKEYTNNNKGSVIIELKVNFYATEKLV